MLSKKELMMVVVGLGIMVMGGQIVHAQARPIGAQLRNAAPSPFTPLALTCQSVGSCPTLVTLITNKVREILDQTPSNPYYVKVTPEFQMSCRTGNLQVNNQQVRKKICLVPYNFSFPDDCSVSDSTILINNIPGAAGWSHVYGIREDYVRQNNDRDFPVQEIMGVDEVNFDYGPGDESDGRNDPNYFRLLNFTEERYSRAFMLRECFDSSALLHRAQ